MLSLSLKMQKAKASPIVQVNQKANALKAQGREIINFSIGIPNFLPAEHIYKAAHAAIDADKGIYLPPQGTDELIEAFQYRLEQDGFGTYEKAEICAAVGAKNALSNLFQVFLNAGDEVIFPAPYWSSYIDVVEMANGVCKIIPCTSDENYKLSAEKLESAINDKTKVFLFNNPSNPTGMIYTESEIKALGDVLVKYPDIWIISDDIYDKMIYDGEKFNHLLLTHPELRSRTCIVQSISKTYGMPGWRVGMVAAPKEVIKAHNTLAANMFMNVCGIAQAAASAAFRGDHAFVEKECLAFSHKRDLVVQSLSQIKGFILPKPQGAFYAFPSVSAYFGKSYHGEVIKDDVHLCEMLLEKAGVACVPGSAFGDASAIRISYALKEDVLRDGLAKFSAFFAECV